MPLAQQHGPYERPRGTAYPPNPNPREAFYRHPRLMECKDVWLATGFTLQASDCRERRWKYSCIHGQQAQSSPLCRLSEQPGGTKSGLGAGSSGSALLPCPATHRQLLTCSTHTLANVTVQKLSTQALPLPSEQDCLREKKSHPAQCSSD